MRRKIGHTRRTYTPRSREKNAKTWGKLQIQSALCGAIFVLLVLLKITLPSGLLELRRDMAEVLVRDTDFHETFSAVGQAVAEGTPLGESLADACVAVFGASPALKQGGEQDAEPALSALTLPDDLPVDVYPEQRVLGFAYASPLEGTVTSLFGQRDDPNGGAEEFHYGIDIAAQDGADIVCFADGMVNVVGESAALGKYLSVTHANGYTTLYAHCQSIAVRSGEAVKCGQTIAGVGRTGNATGSHLHFELCCENEYLDPAYYVA